MFRKTKKTAAKITSLILSAAIVFPMLHGLSISSFVRADDDIVVKNKDNTQLSAQHILESKSRYVTDSYDEPWTGSYIYFGKYDGKPIKFRYLRKTDSLSEDRKETLFLDSDKILFLYQFTDPGTASSNINDWFESDIRAYLNGEFYEDSFTNAEKRSIVTSKEGGGFILQQDDWTNYLFKTATGLDDKIFLLDSSEVLHPFNGYSTVSGMVDWWDDPFSRTSMTIQSRVKEAAFDITPEDYNALNWLLRDGVSNETVFDEEDSYTNRFVGVVDASEGEIDFTYASFNNSGIAPALNVSTDSILFYTVVSGDYSQYSSEYKLTLLDSDISVSVPFVTMSGSSVNFSYSVGGSNAGQVSQMSYLVTDGRWNTGEATILDYGPVTTDGNGNGSFALPGDLVNAWARGYHVYVLAEDINGKYETDYASVPVELTSPVTPVDFSGKNTSNTRLGVSQMLDPRVPESKDDLWQGSYVYFGKYNGMSIKFRVLDNDAVDYSGLDMRTLFLDSDEVLFSKPFFKRSSSDDPFLHVWNDWAASELREYLNNDFLDSSFTSAEKTAIMPSWSTGGRTYPEGSFYWRWLSDFAAGAVASTVALNDKIFLLEGKDVLNPSYGYSSDPGIQSPSGDGVWTETDNYQSDGWYEVPNRVKDRGGVATSWRLITKDAGDLYNDTIATVSLDGHTRLANCCSKEGGIAPALNIDLRDILFSSALNTSYGVLNAEYKLTLLDRNIVLSVPEGSSVTRSDDDEVVFSYALSGDNIGSVTKISYLITKKPLGSDDNSILGYGAVTTTGDGTGSFTLPGSISGTWGENYHVYVLAEDINGIFDTDYASTPVELAKPQTSFGGKTLTNTRLGVDQMSDPTVPATKDDLWQGSYVYFGNNEGTPIRFRVLDQDSTRFDENGEKTLFLDSDAVLFHRVFDESTLNNAWEECSLRQYLNNEFYTGAFTSIEKGSIITSKLEGGDPYPSGNFDHGKFDITAGLDDKVFVLDAEDILTTAYGYYQDLNVDSTQPYYSENQTKYMNGAQASWWLRNEAFSGNIVQVGLIGGSGLGIGASRPTVANGVAPAINVSRDSILFSSAINGDYGEIGTEYKLTLLDPDLDLVVPYGAARDGLTVQIPYDLKGSSVNENTQVSYLITRKAIGETGNEIIDYGRLQAENGGTGTFTVSKGGLTGRWGQDYHVYLVPENNNSMFETDYAGVPVEVSLDSWEGKDLSNTRIGTKEILNPLVPTNVNDGWQGSYVYFGKYQNRPVMYRVLDNDATEFGSRHTLFLDSDKLLFEEAFDTSGSTNVWENSSIRTVLNNTFYTGSFTPTEKHIISDSTVAGHASQNLGSYYSGYAGLNGDKIFLLDEEDLINSNYGYLFDNAMSNATKAPASYYAGSETYWTRTAGLLSTRAGGLSGSGHPSYKVNNVLGVAPALNLNEDLVYFSTAVNGTYGETGTEYKLTVYHDNLDMTLRGDSPVSLNGNTVSFSYNLSGIAFREGSYNERPDQLTYVITSKAWGADGNAILYYGQADADNLDAGNGTGSFTLPRDLEGRWGENYHIYIFAEAIGGKYETDLASMPLELEKPATSFSGKSVDNTQIGVVQIANPRIPTDVNDEWCGSYVYFGQYDGDPMRFRVLDKDATEFGGNTLFLDSDRLLFASEYDGFLDIEQGYNAWSGSSLQATLNGAMFYTKLRAFTDAEKASIVRSSTVGHQLNGISETAISQYQNYVGLNNDWAFVLDIEDVMNGEYGYIGIDGATNYRKEAAENYIDSDDVPDSASWSWLRNAGTSYDPGDGIRYPAGCVNSTNGEFTVKDVEYPKGVAPAMNIDKNAIIFTTAIDGKPGARGTDYKLTLKDTKIDLALNSFSYSGNNVEVNYTLGGNNAGNVTQLSYVVVTIQKTNGLRSESVYAYGKVNVSGSLSGTNTGNFVLPSGLAGTWGTNFKVYIIAEDINETYKTDYASALVEIVPVTSAVINLTVINWTDLDQDQKDILGVLVAAGVFNVEMSGSTIYLDVDKDGSRDFSLTSSGTITRLLTCSISGSKSYTADGFKLTFKVPVKRPGFGGRALRLSDDIGVKFKVDLPNDADPNDVYVKFVASDGRTQTATVAEDGYYIFYINCLELADEITATLYYKDAVVDTNTYSAMQYIEHIRDNIDNYDNADKLEALIDSLQAYGYYMQASDWSDGATHTPIPAPPSTIASSDIQTAKDGLDGFAVEKILGNSGIDESMMISLTMNSKTVLKVYVKPQTGVTITSTDCKPVVFSGVTYYEFDVTDIGPKHLGRPQTITINTNQGTATVNVSAMFYVKNMLNKDTLASNQKMALAAYYFYYSAADNY